MVSPARIILKIAKCSESEICSVISRPSICMHACLYVCMHACMHVCMHACMYVFIYVFIYVSIYVFMDVCMYVCTHACMHACMYVHPFIILSVFLLLRLQSPTTKPTISLIALGSSHLSQLHFPSSLATAGFVDSTFFSGAQLNEGADLAGKPKAPKEKKNGEILLK